MSLGKWLLQQEFMEWIFFTIGFCVAILVFALGEEFFKFFIKLIFG